MNQRRVFHLVRSVTLTISRPDNHQGILTSFHSIGRRRRLALGTAPTAAVFLPRIALAKASAKPAVKFRVRVKNREFGLVVSTFYDKHNMVTVRDLKGGSRIMKLVRNDGPEAKVIERDHEQYAFVDSANGPRLKMPDVTVGPPEPPENRENSNESARGLWSRVKGAIKGIFTTIATGISVILTLVLGGETFFPWGKDRHIYVIRQNGGVSVGTASGSVTSSGFMALPEGAQRACPESPAFGIDPRLARAGLKKQNAPGTRTRF